MAGGSRRPASVRTRGARDGRGLSKSARSNRGVRGGQFVFRMILGHDRRNFSPSSLLAVVVAGRATPSGAWPSRLAHHMEVAAPAGLDLPPMPVSTARHGNPARRCPGRSWVCSQDRRAAEAGGMPGSGARKSKSSSAPTTRQPPASRYRRAGGRGHQSSEDTPLPDAHRSVNQSVHRSGHRIHSPAEYRRSLKMTVAAP